MDGSCPIPSSAGEDERLLAVTLAQTDGSATIAEQTVTLRVGTPSTAFVDVTDKEFQSLSEPRIYSWSSLWSDNSADATVATLTTSVKNGATIGSWTLPATSGYGTMDVKGSFGGKRGPMTAELAFDGTTYLTAELIAKGLGISIIFR